MQIDWSSREIKFIIALNPGHPVGISLLDIHVCLPFLAHLYECSGRVIALPPVSVSVLALVSAALALAKY